MAFRKSQWESPLTLLTSALQDVHHLCGLSSRKEFNYDLRTLEARFCHEGLGFATKVLPTLGKAIDRSFETGVLEAPSGFRTARNSKTPVFGRGIFRLLYGQDGRLLTEPSDFSQVQFQAVAGLRQLCFLLYKLETDIDPAALQSKTNDFVQLDRDLPRWVDLDETLLDASQLLEELLDGFDPSDIIPRHGPGGLATGETLFRKFSFSRKYEGLHAVYPMWDYMVALGPRELVDRLLWYESLTLDSFPTARLTFVPKDSRGPRAISLEPLEIQWIQGGVRSALYAHVERHPLTRGRVNFENQGVNRDLAQFASRNRQYATIDLKDASDRVSLALVQAIYPDVFTKAIVACRSVATRLPNGDVHELRKFAPMGSALCFPIEALTFWSICVSVVTRSRRGSNFSRFDTSSVYVYGDDIIVPSECYTDVCDALERYALVVNRQKSYHLGFFRESCGGEFLSGRDVGVTRVKQLPELHRKPASSPELFTNMVGCMNQLRKRGFLASADTLLVLIERTFGRLPAGLETSPYPNYNQNDLASVIRYNRLAGVRSRWNSSYQRMEYMALFVKPMSVTHHLDGYEGLLRSLTSGSGPTPDRWTFHKRNVLSCRWMPV